MFKYQRIGKLVYCLKETKKGTEIKSYAFKAFSNYHCEYIHLS